MPVVIVWSNQVNSKIIDGKTVERFIRLSFEKTSFDSGERFKHAGSGKFLRDLHSQYVVSLF
jgi:hypothetical protein